MDETDPLGTWNINTGLIMEAFLFQCRKDFIPS